MRKETAVASQHDTRGGVRGDATAAEEHGMRTATDTEPRLFEELDYRESDGIEVSLLWDRGENSVSVFVVDTKAGASFEVQVDARDALRAFHHPYAYAARRGGGESAGERGPSAPANTQAA
jgi:hypothetical protein